MGASEKPGLLVLFDCDGTLVLGRDKLVQPAMIEALDRLTGSDIRPGAMEELDHPRPARWHALETIRENGLPGVDLDEWVELVVRLYADRTGEGRPQGWHPPAGAFKALAALRHDGFRLALLTGIPEEIARNRLDRVDLGQFFPSGQGAFGYEADDRDDLLALAVKRSGTPPNRAVQVADASRDVGAAQALGLHAIAIAHEDDRPRDADDTTATVESMPELVRALENLDAALGNGSARGTTLSRR